MDNKDALELRNEFLACDRSRKEHREQVDALKSRAEYERHFGGIWWVESLDGKWLVRGA